MDKNRKLISWFITLIVVIAVGFLAFWFMTKEADAQTWVYHAPAPVVVHRAPVWTYGAPMAIRTYTAPVYRVPSAATYGPVWRYPAYGRSATYPTPIRSMLFGRPGGVVGCSGGY